MTTRAAWGTGGGAPQLQAFLKNLENAAASASRPSQFKDSIGQALRYDFSAQYLGALRAPTGFVPKNENERSFFESDNKHAIQTVASAYKGTVTLRYSVKKKAATERPVLIFGDVAGTFWNASTGNGIYVTLDTSTVRVYKRVAGVNTLLGTLPAITENATAEYVDLAVIFWSMADPLTFVVAANGVYQNFSVAGLSLPNGAYLGLYQFGGAEETYYKELGFAASDLNPVSNGKIENASGTAGLLLEGALPGAWTRYVDLTAGVGASFLRHDKFELKYSGSAVFRPSTLPGSPEEGEFVYTSATHQFQFWNGSAWVGLSSGSVGVAQVTGTANQVTVSPITGNVVVSLPNDGTLPGRWTGETGLNVGGSVDFYSSAVNRWGIALSGAGGLQIRPTVNAANTNVFFLDSSNVTQASVDNATGIFTTKGVYAPFVGTSTAVDFTIRTNNNARWVVDSLGHFVGNSDNALDIGRSGANRPRIAYIGTRVVIGTDLAAAEEVQVTGRAYFLAGSAQNVIRLSRAHGTNVLLPSKTPAFQIVGDDSTGGAQLNNPPNIALFAPEVGASADQNQSSAKLELIASRSTIAQLNAGTFTAVTTNDFLGEIRFGGDDTVNLRAHGARIYAKAPGTWSATSHPADLYFSTVAVGAVGNATDRWTITSAGHLLPAVDNVSDIGSSGAQRPRHIIIAGHYDVEASPVTLRIQANTSYAAMGTTGAHHLKLNTNSGERWLVEGSTGHFWANSDNVLDIGQTGANRPRTGYFGTRVRVENTDDQPFVGIAYTDTAASGATFLGSRARVGPLAVAAGDVLTGIYGAGYHSGGAFSGFVAAIRLTAQESFTSGAQGAQIELATTTIGTTSRTNRWIITNAGHFVGNVDNTYDIGASAATRPRTGYFGTAVVVATDPGGSEAVRAPSARLGTTNTSVLTSALTIAGTAASSANVQLLAGGRVDFAFYDSAAALDSKRWDLSLDGAGGANSYGLAMRNDAGTLGNWVFKAIRSANTLSTLQFAENGGAVIVGADPGGAQLFRIGGSGNVSGDLTAGARLLLATAASKIVPGATSLALRNNADSADNLLIADVGDLTGRTKLTMPGPLVLTTGASKIIPGATSLALRNNADSADNLLLTDAGAATFRNTVTVTGANGAFIADNRNTPGTNPWYLYNQDGAALRFYRGSDYMYLTTAALYPNTAGLLTLGLSGNRWGKLWGQDASFSLDVTMDVLGTFDHTGTRFSSGTGPVADDVMSWQASAGKWRPRFLQTAFTSGAAVSQNNTDGTFSTFYNSGPTLSGVPTAPVAAPVVTPIYKAMLIDMSAYVLSGTQVYVLDYSVNGGAYTSGRIISTSAKVIHSSLDPTKTYAYKFLIRGGSDSTYSAASSAQNPATTTEANAFGLIVASQIATAFLSAINANIGSITAGQLVSGDGKSILQLDSTFSVPGTVTQGVFFASANPVPGTVTGMYIDFTATTTNPLLHHSKFDLLADGSAILKGVVRDVNSKFVIDVGQTTARLITIIDEQGSPKTRVKIGEVNTGTADWGLQVFDNAGATIVDMTASNLLIQDAAVKLKADFTGALITVTDNQGAPKTRAKLGKVGAGTTDYGLQVFDNAGATIVDMTTANLLIQDAAVKFKADFTGALLTITDAQGSPVTRLKLGKIAGLSTDYGLQVFADNANKIVELSGAAMFLQDSAVTPTIGINIKGTKPASWTRYLDFVAAGTNPVLKIDSAISVNNDGSAAFAGVLNASGVLADTLQVNVLATLAGINQLSGFFAQSGKLYTDTTKKRWALENDNLSVWDDAETGTATSGAAATLTDTAKAWPVDYWSLAGAMVTITSGTGSGQTRTVVSNTATVLTVSPNWGTNPDATSVYRLDNVLRMSIGTAITTGSTRRLDDTWDDTAGAGGAAKTQSKISSLTINATEFGPYMYNDIQTNIPASDDNYTLNFTVTSDASGGSNFGTGTNIYARAEIWYRTSSGGAFVLLDDSVGVNNYSTGSSGVLKAATFVKTYNIPGITVYLEFRIRVKSVTAGTPWTGTVSAQVDVTTATWSSGSVRTTRAPRFFTRTAPNFSPALILEPIATVPADADGRKGDVTFANSMPRYHDGSVWAPMGLRLIDTQTFTADGTWTKPANAVLVRIVCIGAGGGGGGGRGGATGTNRNGGTGGGGGARQEGWFNAADMAATETVVVGAAGGGGTGGVSPANGNNGSAGGASRFGTSFNYLLAGGGGFGAGGDNSANSFSGGGGGGLNGTGGNGGTVAAAGGSPSIAAEHNTGFGGAPSSVGGHGFMAVYGGGAGAGMIIDTAGRNGGVSLFGGSGGGAGGSTGTANNAHNGGDGGAANQTTAESGNGATGGAAGGTAGTAGAAGGGIRCGGGGGGGGSTSTGVNGGAGGAGGVPGGGGGGGGGGTSVGNGGNGGAGGRGEVRVYTYA